MRMKIKHLWENLSSGYWFIPGGMTLAAVGLASGMLLIDRAVLPKDTRLSWLYSGGAEGARALLSTIASSIITVAGVVFSITIAALTQASSQFGPRLLRNFMSDRGNQIVLGTFVGTFVYCLLVLRTVRGEDGDTFVPNAATTAGVLLAVASIAVLIYFIHHVAMSLQAPFVVAAVTRELSESIAKLGHGTQDGEEPTRPEVTSPDWAPDEVSVVTAGRDGYVQAIDYSQLVQRAHRAGLVLQLQCRPGDYVMEGGPLLRAWPAARCGSEVHDGLRDVLILGRWRTPEQDLEHGIRQLVEVAVRALSPGVNDPFTAINCVDALGATVCRIARHRLPPMLHHDSNGTVRVVARTTTLEGIVDAAFQQIRQFGRGVPSVLIRMLEVIAAAAQTSPPAGRRALLKHVQMIWEDAQGTVWQERDRRDLQARYEAALAALTT